MVDAWVLGAVLCAIPLLLLGIAFALTPTASDLKLSAMPPAAWIYVQAIKSALTKGNDHARALKRVRRIQVSLTTPVRVSRQRVAAFKRLAEYGDSPASPEVPVMYPIVECFKLVIQAMVLPAFPFNVLGSVLTRHSSTLLKSVREGDELLYSVTIEPDAWKTTAKGDTEVDMVQEARLASDNTLVWRAITTAIILNPKRVKGGKATQAAPTGTDTGSTWQVAATWRLRSDVGRRYGMLNGDLNPIHLYPITSKLFGFKRPIAHALYLVARAEASVRAHGVPVSAPVTLSSEFHRPTLLPATLKCSVQPAPSGQDYKSMMTAPGSKVAFAVRTEDQTKDVITGAIGVAAKS